MKTGKLTNEQLKKLIFDKLPQSRDEVVTGPGVGRDCALLDLGDGYTVCSADPITGTEKNIGRLCVHICTNDIAAEGAEPVGMMITMLIPPKATMEQVEQVVDDAIAACRQVGVALIGGHTEISTAVNRFVLSGVAIGRRSRVERERIKVGDKLLMSKYAALEGTAIIAAERESELRKHLGDRLVEEALSLADQTSVVAEGRLGAKHSAKLMHDATEGGILGAAWEMADCAELSVRLELDKIPILESTKKICEYLSLDLYRLISSGVMLIAISPENAAALSAEMAERGIPVSEIGEFTEGGSVVVSGGSERELVPPDTDELYKAVE